MVDTSYNPGYAPYAKWSAQQAPVPASVHNLPASVPANGSVTTSLIVTEGFTLIAAGVTASQAGTMSIQRYLDAGGTVIQGNPVSVTLTANIAANIDITNGKPFASFTLTITNSNGASTSNLTNFALLLQSSTSNSPDTGMATAMKLSGNTTTDGSTTITTGGTAQNLFGGTVPTNGYSICNPDLSNDLWVSDTATAAANGQGSIRVVANGGYYATEPGQKPINAVSIVGATTGQKITARRW